MVKWVKEADCDSPTFRGMVSFGPNVLEMLGYVSQEKNGWSAQPTFGGVLEGFDSRDDAQAFCVKAAIEARSKRIARLNTEIAVLASQGAKIHGASGR